MLNKTAQVTGQTVNIETLTANRVVNCLLSFLDAEPELLQFWAEFVAAMVEDEGQLKLPLTVESLSLLEETLKNKIRRNL